MGNAQVFSTRRFDRSAYWKIMNFGLVFGFNTPTCRVLLLSYFE